MIIGTRKLGIYIEVGRHLIRNYNTIHYLEYIRNLRVSRGKRKYVRPVASRRTYLLGFVTTPNEY